MRLEETPTDILTSTARSFAEDDFYDRYGTSGRMTSAKISASNLRQSGEQAELGGLLSAELTLARRGVICGKNTYIQFTSNTPTYFYKTSSTKRYG